MVDDGGHIGYDHIGGGAIFGVRGPLRAAPNAESHAESTYPERAPYPPLWSARLKTVQSDRILRKKRVTLIWSVELRAILTHFDPF